MQDFINSRALVLGIAGCSSIQNPSAVSQATTVGYNMNPIIAVLVPCYNEQATIGEVVRDFRAA
ncbi:MAG: glycosyltransferase, partial [Steroidobacteraceae bacterium]